MQDQRFWVISRPQIHQCWQIGHLPSVHEPLGLEYSTFIWKTGKAVIYCNKLTYKSITSQARMLMPMHYPCCICANQGRCKQTEAAGCSTERTVESWMYDSEAKMQFSTEICPEMCSRWPRFSFTGVWRCI